MSLRQSEDSFSKQMRKATRDIHNVSDALINAKLAFALSDHQVWLDGLVVFYPIFRFLETNTTPEILPIEYHRADAFEQDIRYYSNLLQLDPVEQLTKRRPSVEAYLKHLNDIKETEPTLLLAFVYHLYMGLLSGGQILQKKRKIFSRTPNDGTQLDGYRVTYFTELGADNVGGIIGQLKKQMREIIDGAGAEMDETMKCRMIEESRMVFVLNNSIVRSIDGVQRTILKKFGITIGIVLTLYSCYYYLFKRV